MWMRRKVSSNFIFSCRLIYQIFQVRDGTGETDPLIGKYCGSTLPAPILSTANGLWIRFKSDSSVSRAGFRAMYEVGETMKPPFYVKHMTPTECQMSFIWKVKDKSKNSIARNILHASKLKHECFANTLQACSHTLV